MTQPANEGAEGQARPGRLRRMRRRRSAEPRTHQTVIRHTAEEFAQREALAVMNGVSRAELYERSLLAGGAQAAAKLETLRLELYGVRRVLAGVAVNVNQMAKVANATGEVPDNLAPTVDAVGRLVQRIDTLTGEVERSTWR